MESEILCAVCCVEISDEIHCTDCSIHTCPECFFEIDCSSGKDLIDCDGDYIMILTV